ncbi:MAG: rod shape-determining protein MreC [bacterium]
MNLYKSPKINNIRGILFVLCLVIVLLSYAGFFRIIPILDIFSTTIGQTITDMKKASSSFFSKFEDNEKLVTENIELRKEIIKKDVDIQNIKDSVKDLESVKKLLNFYNPKADIIVTKNISIVPSDKVPVKITIDKGLKNGIKEGKAVFNDSGSLIGKIYVAREYSSDILPYYVIDNIKLPIKSTSTSTALVDGYKDGLVVCTDIGLETTVKEGDLFFTSSLGDQVSEGIYVGKVVKISADDKKKFYLEADILNVDILYVYL